MFVSLIRLMFSMGIPISLPFLISSAQALLERTDTPRFCLIMA